MKLNKLHWLSAIVTLALVSGLIVHLISSADDVPQNPAYLLSSLPTIDNPKANSQVTAVTMKLAKLQSQVLRLNALGDRLAEDASIPGNEFNFQQAPPSSGPMYQADSVKQKSLVELSQGIDTLAETLEHEEKQLKMLESVSFGHHIENTWYLSGRPITKGWLSSYFGLRKDPFNGKPAMHKGVNFAGSENDDIIATASGVVSWASSRYGYGNLIEINHGDGLKARYDHNKTIAVSFADSG
jgi:murein DD-endopeptidase MepM/ murein hydrolase activator NlpD